MPLKLFYVNTSPLCIATQATVSKKKKSVKAIGYDLDQSGGLQLALIMSQLGVFDSIPLFPFQIEVSPFQKSHGKKRREALGGKLVRSEADMSAARRWVGAREGETEGGRKGGSEARGPGDMNPLSTAVPLFDIK